MKNKILTLVALLALAGCESTYEDKTGTYRLPAELKDCTIFELTNSSDNRISVMRCPNSETSTKDGTDNVVVIDGMNYIPAPVKNKKKPTSVDSSLPPEMAQ